LCCISFDDCEYISAMHRTINIKKKDANMLSIQFEHSEIFKTKTGGNIGNLCVLYYCSYEHMQLYETCVIIIPSYHCHHHRRLRHQCHHHHHHALHLNITAVVTQ